MIDGSGVTAWRIGGEEQARVRYTLPPVWPKHVVVTECLDVSTQTPGTHA